jgi:hypothetical protein
MKSFSIIFLSCLCYAERTDEVLLQTDSYLAFVIPSDYVNYGAENLPNEESATHGGRC